MNLPQLRADWHRLLFKAWSVRLMLLGALLSALELGMSVLTGNPPIDPTKFAALYALVSFTAAGARLFAQVGITPGHDEEEGK